MVEGFFIWNPPVCFADSKLLRCPKYSAAFALNILTAAPNLARFIVHRTRFASFALYTREPAPTGRLFGEIRILRYAQNDIGLSLRAYRRYAWQSVSPFIGTVKTVPYSNAFGLQLLNRRGGYIHPVLTGQSQHLISHLR